MNSKATDEKCFNSSYFIDEVLGSGAFSVVKKCRDKISYQEYAVKIIDVTKTKNDELKEIDREAKICRMLNHVNIVRFFSYFKEEKKYYLLYELVTGGELFENIVERDFYSEVDASRCIQQIFEAVSHCHSLGIIHRDLKPENLLLECKHPRAKVKLTDFGLAVEEIDDKPHWYGLAGTPCYLAPEVLSRKPFDKSVDLWGCGCILYILLVGYPPFWESDSNVLKEKIKSGLYGFDSHHWEHTTYEAKNIIRKLLTANPKRRLTISEGLKHPWVRSREKTASHRHKQQAVERLKSFNARRKFKGAIHTTMMVATKVFAKHIET